MKAYGKEITIRSGAAEYLSYIASIGDQSISVELRYEDENIWLTQRLMAKLYGVEVSTVNEHIAKVFSDGELQEEATVRKFRIVQQEGNRMVNKDTWGVIYKLLPVNQLYKIGWSIATNQFFVIF